MDQKDDLLPEQIFLITDLQVLEDKKLFEALSGYINVLVNTDFQRLISLLYRMDVSEKKLVALLKEHAGEDSGKIIAALMVERQIQKIKSRQDHGRADNIDEDESW
jgi:hypothetical protein